MKKNVIVLICLALGLCGSPAVFAQQKPHYTQYVLNQFIVNPAVTGIENYIDLKFSHRHQWVGIQDAPVTSYMSVHGPIGKTDYRKTATSFDLKGENQGKAVLGRIYGTGSAPWNRPAGDQ